MLLAERSKQGPGKRKQFMICARGCVCDGSSEQGTTPIYGKWACCVPGDANVIKLARDGAVILCYPVFAGVTPLLPSNERSNTP